MKRKAIFLTIGGSDPSGGAGIQADIKTASRLGLYPCSVITAITAQNTSSFISKWSVETERIASQLDAVLADITPDAVKIGMIPSVDAAKAVAEAIVNYGLTNVVVDPIFSPTLSPNHEDENLVKALIDDLLPLATLVTPNRPEKARIESVSGEKIENLADAVLIKGGHSDGEEVTDLLLYHEMSRFSGNLPSSTFPTINFHNSSMFSTDQGLPEWENFPLVSREFSHRRLPTDHTHGTGCILSSAIACWLAKGHNLPEAVKEACHFVHNALKEAATHQIGKGPYGPALV